MLIAAVMLLAAAPAADPCRQHYAALRYRDAISACTDALGEGGDRAELYTLIGLSLAGAGDAATARRVFAALKVMRPGAQLPPGLSPKLRAPFEAAADATVVSLSAVREGNRLVVTISDGPSQPVDKLHASTSGPPIVAPRGDGPVQLAVPAGDGPITVRAFDVLGGELASVELLPPAAEPEAPAPSARPAVLSWRLWLVASIVFAVAAGAALGWAGATFPRARAEPWADSAAALQAEGTRAQIVSGVTFSLAGVSALAAVLLGLTQ